ncbi:Non-classical arabinogalactan protein 30 [Rhynchospora pubera]|uniref:Non-classical arabinogalactan protein 30 n=1 Tax=Rhynchospora pubera TaxID=906938 RepID=A0AAV8GTC6_9POAL|nr:Non-classical arabinogalactan protein 30 [Rhynchospora pubera]
MASLNSVTLVLISTLLLFVSPILSTENTTHPLTSGSTNYTSIAIVGVVFCRSCKFRGYVKSMDESPITGAIVRVTCYYTSRKPVSMAITTGRNGYFSLVWPNVAKFSQKKCRAYLSWSPYSFCKMPIYQNGSISAPLKFDSVQNVTYGPQAVYSSGVLLYGATANNTLCHVP